jgi:RimJ/RimL family protein N-acetyltransferase
VTGRGPDVRARLPIETERLILREWRDEDLEPFARINADPEVMTYLNGGDRMTLEETRTMLNDRVRKHWEEHGYGWFAVDLKETGAFIGFVGLHIPVFLPEVFPAVEVGWRLDRSVWNRGLATEGARASLRFGFEDLDLDRIISIRHRDNLASGRVMDKLGMTLDRETTLPANGWPLLIYALERDDWLAGA